MMSVMNYHKFFEIKIPNNDEVERVEVKDVRLPIMMQRLWLPKLRLTERPGPIRPPQVDL